MISIISRSTNITNSEREERERGRERETQTFYKKYILDIIEFINGLKRECVGEKEKEVYFSNAHWKIKKLQNKKRWVILHEAEEMEEEEAADENEGGRGRG